MAGGKTQLLPELIKRLPSNFGNYFEGFLGGGALYWALRQNSRYNHVTCTLADTNHMLIETYRAIKTEVDQVIERLRKMPNTEKFFYKLRDQGFPSGICSNLREREEKGVEKAAWFIYMNKTAFNGLWRVNKSGKFNVPFGYYKNPTICDEENLRACSASMWKTKVLHDDFEQVLLKAKEGDLVFCDPPYLPITSTSNFSAYTKDGFGLQDHIRLRDVLRQLKKRKVKILLSNSNCTDVRELYAKGFVIEEVMAKRNINSDGNKRGKIVELLIW